MKNYYEILEVDKNASNEIIKVAYKSLVKKYHPDLNKSNELNTSEDKIKEINDAYDTLSDPIKRSKYDQSLLNENVSVEQYNLVVQENNRLKMELNKIKNTQYQYNNPKYNNNYYKQNMNNIQHQQNTEKQNSYNNNFSNNSTPLKTLFAILLFFIILNILIFIILHIPSLKNLFFNGNAIILLTIFLLFYFYFWKNR